MTERREGVDTGMRRGAKRKEGVSKRQQEEKKDETKVEEKKDKEGRVGG